MHVHAIGYFYIGPAAVEIASKPVPSALGRQRAAADITPRATSCGQRDAARDSAVEPSLGE